MRKATTVVPETTIGLDLGDRFTHGCVLDAAGGVLERMRFSTSRRGLARAFARDLPVGSRSRSGPIRRG